jgi:hypothetical protein
MYWSSSVVEVGVVTGFLLGGSSGRSFDVWLLAASESPIAVVGIESGFLLGGSFGRSFNVWLLAASESDSCGSYGVNLCCAVLVLKDLDPEAQQRLEYTCVNICGYGAVVSFE